MYLSKKFQILRSLEKVDDPFHMQVQNRAMFFERQRYYLAVFSPLLLASAKLQNKSLSERAKINHVFLFVEQSISSPKFLPLLCLSLCPFAIPSHPQHEIFFTSYYKHCNSYISFSFHLTLMFTLCLVEKDFRRLQPRTHSTRINVSKNEHNLVK